jgi:hypothetical protein
VTGVYDPLTDEPIRARVLEAGTVESTVLLRGKPPADVDLQGAVLKHELPQDKVAAASDPVQPAGR